MKINHLGAKNCITGSCHLVQTKVGVNILVDCGKAYGNDPELAFDRFPVSPRDIGYLFLTHAHIDHIGRVPELIDAGFQGEIICTHATANGSTKKHGDFTPMTELSIINTAIGIIVGAIAVLKKAFGIFGGRNMRHRKIFKNEFAFCLRVAVQHGDNHLAYLIERNKNNKSRIRHLFGAVTGHGVRVGWRAEFCRR